MNGLTWATWAPIREAVALAPTTAGVYEARLASTGTVVYVGRAGDRRGGVSQRLRAYAVGKSPDSGLSGKAANRALTDPDFCEQLLDAARAGRPWTISEIAVLALGHLDVEVRSAASETFAATEAELLASYPWGQLWNVRR